MPQVFQDLSVLAAQVDNGAFVPPEDPNYLLFERAIQTIKDVLSRSLASGEPDSHFSEPLNVSIDDWMPSIGQDSWLMDDIFWHNLAEHPLLATDGSEW